MPTTYYNYKVNTINITGDWKMTHDWQLIDSLTKPTDEQLELWNEGYKTIFDPSPVGFRVPPSVVFDKTTSNCKLTNGYYTIYTNSGDQKICLPGIGERAAQNSIETNPNDISRIQSAGFWQTTPMSSANYSYRIHTSFHVWWRNAKNTNSSLFQWNRGGNSRADAQPVLPIKE